MGENAKIGAGAVVLESVPKNATVVGIPAKVVKISKEEKIDPIYEKMDDIIDTLNLL